MTENGDSPQLERVVPESDLARVVTERVDTSLSPFAIGADGRASLERPISLLVTIGRLGEPPSEPVRREVATVVGFLERYVRIRRRLFDSAYETNRQRDCALLASDFLHAGAYRAVAESSLSQERKLACYRHLTAGSKAITERLAASPDERVGPRATLVGTAGALGAVTAGFEDDVADAVRRYGESVAEVADMAVNRSGVAPETALTAALEGDSDCELPDDDRLETHIERARRALEGIPDGSARRRLETATWALPTGE